MSKTAKRIAERTRAERLGAVKARELIGYYLPKVLRTLNDDQVDKVQRVLDADVVNPAIKRELRSLEAELNSVAAPYRQAHPKYAEYLKAKEGLMNTLDDVPVPVDSRRLLTSDALKPRTDNPDEAALLPLIPEILQTKGVWMQVGSDSSDASKSNRTRHKSGWVVWLTLGPKEHSYFTLPTQESALTREALLGNSEIRSEYSQNVTYGPTRTALRGAIARLDYQIVWGKRIHQDFAEDRANTNIVVRVVSEEAGRAGDFPDPAIWDLPNDLIKKAKEHFDANAVNAARVYIIAAAVQASIAARAYHTFIARKDAGAGAAVKVLEVLKVAGEIAEIGLDLATGLEVLRLAKGGYQLVRKTVVRKEAAMPDAVMNKAVKHVQEYSAKNPATSRDLVHIGTTKADGKTAYFNQRGLRENCVGSVAACERTRITKDIWTEEDIARKFGETDKTLSGKNLDLAGAREYIERAIDSRLSQQAYDLGVGRLTPGHYVVFGGNSTKSLRHVVRATVHKDGRLVIYDPANGQRQITWFGFKGKYGPGTRAYRIEAK